MHMRTHRRSSLAPATLLATIAAAFMLTAFAAAERASGLAFYPDDPVPFVADSQDAGGVRPKPVDLAYDEASNLFGRLGDPSTGRRALSVNTIDEVPDSSWFTNRIGSRPIAPGTIAAPAGNGPAEGVWTVTQAKSDGVTPGFTVLDAAGVRWFIKFDPPDWPEMATGAEMISTAIFRALGYHVPDNHIVTLTRDRLAVHEAAKRYLPDGRSRPLVTADLERLLSRAGRRRDGTYRAIASRALDGTPLGPFLYYGTRPDDPNDIVPHEHRRELRALRVFAAWTNHADSKSINSLDTLVEQEGRRIVRHHLIDFGATLGSASIKPRDFDEGHQYIYDPHETIKGVLGFGLYIPRFHRITYPDIPAVGHFSAEAFEPDAWKPRVPNAAFLRARPDDLFWGARRVAAFTDDMIRAIVGAAAYSDPRATQHVADTLIKRRDLIARAWLTNVNPVNEPRLENGVLTFRNAATDAGVANPPDGYRTTWYAFDNASGEATPLASPVETSTAKVAAPVPLPAREGAFVRVDISAGPGSVAAWTVPIQSWFRRTTDGWELVGLTRLADPD